MNFTSPSGISFSNNAYNDIYDNEPYEYSLVAYPGKEVEEKVIAEKQAFYEEFKEKTAIKTQPHITIANFLVKEAMEDTIIRWMQKIFVNQRSFTVTLNNYSGFPPHTIYLRVQNPAPFQQLAKEFKSTKYIYQFMFVPAHETYFKASSKYCKKASGRHLF